MGIGQRDNLTAIGRIGEDFLIAGHRRVEHDFATGDALRADSVTTEYGAIGKCENRGLK